jgi:hypothetical protein
VVSKCNFGRSSSTAGVKKKSLTSQNIAHRRPVTTSLNTIEEYSSTLLLNIFRIATTSYKCAQQYALKMTLKKDL